MLRKTVIALGAFALGFVLGSVFGFGNGVEYNKDKQAEKQAEPGFDANKDEPVQIDLEFDPQH